MIAAKKRGGLLIEHYNGAKWSVAVGPTSQANYNELYAAVAGPNTV